MKDLIPIPLKIALLVLGSTALYTYIGQLVPQKEVLPPPPTVEMEAGMTPEDLAAKGLEIAAGKGLCFTCHTTGQGSKPGLRFPDLDGVGVRAETRIEGMDGLTYLARSMYHPDEFIVEGFSPGMPKIHKPPIGLGDDEIIMVLAYLQSLGGEITVSTETTVDTLGVE